MALGGALPGLGPGCLIFLAAGLGCGLQRKTSAPLERQGVRAAQGQQSVEGDLHPSQSRPHVQSTGAGNSHQGEGWDVNHGEPAAGQTRAVRGPGPFLPVTVRVRPLANTYIGLRM